MKIKVEISGTKKEILKYFKEEFFNDKDFFFAHPCIELKLTNIIGKRMWIESFMESKESESATPIVTLYFTNKKP